MKKLNLAILIMVLVGFAFAEIPPVIPNTYVQDHANVLTSEDEVVIQEQLNQWKIKYNIEFGIATVITTSPSDINSFAVEMARTYGIGAKDGEKRGILLLLAIQDRKWRFEISRHMEAVLTDGQSGSIGRNVLVPALKKAKDSSSYKDAILLTLQAVEQQVIKNIEPEKKDEEVVSNNTNIVGLVLFIIIPIVVIFEFFMRRRRKRKEEEMIRLRELERKRIAIIHEQHGKLAKSTEVKYELGYRETPRQQEKPRQSKVDRERKQREEDEKQTKNRREREDSYSSSNYSSSSSSSSSYSSDSSSSSSGSFGGGSDFGGGGSSGSW